MPVLAALLAFLLGACAHPIAEGWPPCSSPVFDTQGHRGARAYRPENTLPAMLYALKAGVRTLEMDVSVTRDDVLVLSHAPRLLPELCKAADGAPAAHVPIRSLTVRQVQEHDCGAFRHPRFPGQQAVAGTPPPTLESVFALAEEFSGRSIRYSIEAKIHPSWDPTLTPTPERFAELILQALAAADVADRTTVQSFDRRILSALRARRSTVRTALLVGMDRQEIIREKLTGDPVAAAEKLGAAVLSPQWQLVTQALVNDAHARGIAVIPWTVNDAATMRKMIALGVDGMISDDPDLMSEVADEGIPATQGVCFPE